MKFRIDEALGFYGAELEPGDSVVIYVTGGEEFEGVYAGRAPANSGSSSIRYFMHQFDPVTEAVRPEVTIIFERHVVAIEQISD